MASLQQCEWCGTTHPQAEICRPRPAFTRRRFFGLLAAGVAGLVVAPAGILQQGRLTPALTDPWFQQTSIPTYETLRQSYEACVIGSEAPNCMVVSPQLLRYFQDTEIA